ncbi:MAG: HAMP domain-containing histidine kinase [Lewinellaceae bacterium]|nr:HAMP domain-containing histidine kinase [Lewinellaceae bacterium]
MNEILKHESERIKFQLEKEGELPHSSYMFDSTPVDETSTPFSQFNDTLIFETYADKLIPYRTYEFTALVGTERLKISLRHILLEMNELILGLFAATTLILMLLATGLFFISQKISEWAWKPFFRNLSKLKNYDITQKKQVHLEASGISEFEALNQVATALMNQVERDFQNLKEFNENISHEMQTPLAIIRNKMVLLLESQSLGEKELQWVQAAYQEANKLSKIGKALNLISRIENREFPRLDSVDVRAIIDNIISKMEEIIKFKDLKMAAKLNAARVKCDPILADILFTNLIKNAVQHNREGGYIRLLLNEEKFELENTGEVLQKETAQLFNRFQRGNTATDSFGLGLAISQKICELYGFRLGYEHHEGKHKLSLFFNS